MPAIIKKRGQHAKNKMAHPVNSARTGKKISCNISKTDMLIYPIWLQLSPVSPIKNWYAYTLTNIIIINNKTHKISRIKTISQSNIFSLRQSNFFSHRVVNKKSSTYL